jgi:hypothetical protein
VEIHNQPVLGLSNSFMCLQLLDEFAKGTYRPRMFEALILLNMGVRTMLRWGTLTGSKGQQWIQVQRDDWTMAALTLYVQEFIYFLESEELGDEEERD